MKERDKFILLIVAFVVCYYLPFDNPRIRGAALEAFLMVQEYARHHILTCLVPAFFIAGAISCFISQAAVIKYFGAGAKKILSYSVASVSGTVLSVCRDLPAGSGNRTGDYLFVFRPGRSCFGCYPDRQGAGLEAGSGQGTGRRAFFCFNRTCHALSFPKGR